MLRDEGVIVRRHDDAAWVCGARPALGLGQGESARARRKTSCSRGEVLRRCLTGAQLKSTLDARALTEVCRVHANLNRIGGLLKLAIGEGVSDRSSHHRLNLELIDSIMDVRKAVNRLAGQR
jgi:hypothetical protein